MKIVINDNQMAAHPSRERLGVRQAALAPPAPCAMPASGYDAQRRRGAALTTPSFSLMSRADPAQASPSLPLAAWFTHLQLTNLSPFVTYCRLLSPFVTYHKYFFISGASAFFGARLLGNPQLAPRAPHAFLASGHAAASGSAIQNPQSDAGKTMDRSGNSGLVALCKQLSPRIEIP